MFKKLIAILKRKNWFDRIMFIIALLFSIIMIAFAFSKIGWYTVFISISINIVYDEIKDLIDEINKKDLKKIENNEVIDIEKESKEQEI